MRKRTLAFIGIFGLAAAVLGLRKRPAPEVRLVAAPQREAPVFGNRWTAYVVGLFLLVLATVLAGTELLTVRSPPENESELSIAFATAGRPTLGEYATDTDTAAFDQTPNREPELESSSSTQVEVEAAGCSSPVAVRVRVQLDPRWLRAVRATRLHETLVLRTSYDESVPKLAIHNPLVPGTFGLAVKGHLSDLSVQLIAPDVRVPVSTEYQKGSGSNDTVVTGEIPDAELRRISPTSDLQDELMQFTFLAPWLSSRGYQSCYLRLPTLVGGIVLKEPLGSQDIDNLAVRPSGPEEANTQITTQDAEVDLAATNPAPNSAGPTRLWSCKRGSLKHPEPHAPDCHATVVLTLPNQEVHLQLITIILAALLSGSLLAIGAAFRRRLLGI